MAEKIKPMVVKNPPPKKKSAEKDDVNFIGNELVKLKDQLNEMELSVDSLRINIKRVMDRMGL